MVSPTQRTKALMKADGWIAEIVERYITQIHKRIDLFDCIDLIAVRKTGDDTAECIGIQTTSGSNHASRRTKILASPGAQLFCLAGNAIWLISWTKAGPAGKRKTWKARIEIIQAKNYLAPCQETCQNT